MEFSEKLRELRLQKGVSQTKLAADIHISRLFKDKLPPKWHFAVWGVLGIMILIPAGLNGRYTLFHWQLVVEVIKSWFGDYTFTQVLFPIRAGGKVFCRA